MVLLVSPPPPSISYVLTLPYYNITGRQAIQWAKYYRDKAALQRAQAMKLTHCELLDKLNGG